MMHVVGAASLREVAVHSMLPQLVVPGYPERMLLDRPVGCPSKNGSRNIRETEGGAGSLLGPSPGAHGLGVLK